MSASNLSKQIEQLNERIDKSFSDIVGHVNLIEKCSIDEMENFYFPFDVFSSHIRRLLPVLNELEGVKNDFILAREGKRGTRPDCKKAELAWLNVFAILQMFTDSLIDIKFLKRDELPVKAPELDYCRLLRNDFIQHPKIKCPFFSFGIGVTQQKNELPTCSFAPSGFGFTKYWKHFEELIEDVDYKKLPYEEQVKRNKHDYQTGEGWKRISSNKDLVCRIKAHGLPPPIQDSLASEIHSIYEEVVMPLLEDRAKILRDKA